MNVDRLQRKQHYCLMQMWYNIQKVRKDGAFMEKLANVRRIAAVL